MSLGNGVSGAVRSSDDLTLPTRPHEEAERTSMVISSDRTVGIYPIYQLAVLSLIRLLHETRGSYCPFVHGHPSTSHGTSPTHSYAPLAHSYLSTPINNSALLFRANQASAQH